MDPDLTIVLLGNSGVGKSASGNTILGRRAFESRRSSRSVTTQISTYTDSVLGKRISVVDTPGIVGSEGEIETLCQELLQSSRPCLFLVVVKIDQFTTEQRNTVEASLKVIGEEGFNKCYLLFTGDVLDNMTLDDFINEDPNSPLKVVVERFAGRHHVFNNETGGQDQVRELLEKSGHLSNVLPTSAEIRPVRLVLLGLPGDGKSASGNTILGSDQFQSASGFNSVSTETVSKSATVEGRQVTVVDTPGITGKVLSPKKLFKEIVKAIIKAEPGPHAFIIVVRIGRITEAEIKLFELLHKLFGRDALRYTMVLFTYGDELKGQSISSMIQSNKHVKELVLRCDNRYTVFDNTQRQNRQQVTQLMAKIDEMFRAHGGQHYTSERFYKVQKLSLKFNILIDQMWEECCQWFTSLLKEADAHREEYNHLV